MPVELSELFFGFLKVLFVVAGVLYVVFSVVAIRQIHTMQKSLMTSLSGKLRALGYIHLVFAVLVLLFFIVSL
jgi:hypothetical protein